MKAPDNDFFTAWYRRWFQKLDEKPPAEVWENISESLDLDEVWLNISETLDAENTRKVERIYTVLNALFLAFFCLFIPAFPLSDYILDTYPYQQSEWIPPIDEDTITEAAINAGESFNPALSMKQIDLFDRLENMPSRHYQQGFQNDKSTAISERIGSVQYFSFPGLDSCRLIATQAEISVIQHESAEDTYSYPEKRPERQWYIGAMAAKNNTWLLNYQTRQGLNPSQLNQTNLTYTSEFGVLAGAVIKSGMQLQLEWYMHSQTGQSYQEYINALRVDRSVKLDYNKFQLLGIKDLWKRRTAAIPFIAAGFYASYLKEAIETIDGQSSIISDDYNDVDLGFAVGFGLRYHFSDYVFIQPSFRSSYSLKNTYRGNDLIPGSFLPSRNAQVGVNVGIHIIF